MHDGVPGNAYAEANFNTGGDYNPDTGMYDMDQGFSSDFGDDSWGGGGIGDGPYYCNPVYVSCVSAPNVCGWTNTGRQDIACGGTCSAITPADPVFTINGEEKKAGETCIVTDECGNALTGIVTCDGKCAVSDTVCRNTPNPDDTEPGGGGPDYPGYIETIISFLVPPWVENSINTRSALPDDKHFVAIKAVPNLVRKGKPANIYVYMANLDYCIVEGSNNDKWLAYGLTKAKKEYLERLGINIPEDVNNNIKGIGNIFYVQSSAIITETVFKVSKCYSIDHKGDKIEYIPSKENGNITEATVKVVPKFIEY